ncbi:putative C6 transcription factor [Pestalotiopsis sp. NC0098]|nr:putative C6 transcription factor [Pestalotiopsis sp. NC0098]
MLGNTAESPPRKRPRVAEEVVRRRTVKACDSCRKQKERCEGGVPCGRCIRLRRVCQVQATTTFLDDDTERASRLDQEKMERLQLMERMLGHFIGHVPNEMDELRRVAETIGVGDQPRWSDSTSNERAHDSDDSTIPDESFTRQEIAGNAFHYSGELSHWNFSKRVHDKIHRLGQESDPHEAICEKEYYRARHLQISGSNDLSVARWFPPQPVAEFLIALFFKYGQTNYFYVEEEWVGAKLESVYKPTADGTSDQSPIWCILLTIMAIGTQFVALDSARNDELPIDHSMSQGGTPVEADVGISLYQQAAKLIPDMLAIASVESVQAFLLLGVYTLPQDTSGLAYTYLGVAIKMAIQNGMHRTYSGVPLDAHALQVRTRLWWTIYTLEKRICILHGRPLSISRADIDVELPTDTTEFRSPNFANFQAIIMLTPYLEAVASTIGRLRDSSKARQTHCFEELVRQSNGLKTWWSSLPSGIRSKNLDPHEATFRANVHLNLAFLLTQVFMGRPFLFTYNAALDSPGPTSKMSLARDTLASDCIKAAHQIVDLCRLLNNHGGLARASYIEYSSCQAALLVLIAHSLSENTKHIRDCLLSGMNLMRAMTKGTDSANSEFPIVELLERAIRRLNTQLQLQASKPNQQTNAYEQFKNWAQLWKQQSPKSQTCPSETDQPPSETSATMGITTSLWPQVESFESNFALEPFFPYPYLIGEDDFGQTAGYEYPQDTSLISENLEQCLMD